MVGVSRTPMVVGLMSVSLLCGGGAQAQDASLTCAQLTDQVGAQNAIIKEKNEDKADLQSARPDPGAADPEIRERLDDIAANKATARATSLVALGRQKKCFK